jgi:DNA-binding transcriptional LysR family regulator
MNISQLYYFQRLSETEHYGRTSKELFITQPTLSNSINNLERELGVSLFERTGRNVRLTSEGMEFRRHVRVALNEIEKGVALMRSYRQLPR